MLPVTISVVIPCFNAKDTIRQAIESVITQDVGQTEIILVDDGSMDGTSIIIEKEFPSVKLIRTENQGPSKARNLGTRSSKGEFIQYLDADDLLVKGKLKIQLDALVNSKADVAYGDWQRLRKFKSGNYEFAEVVRRELRNPEIDLFTYFWCPPAVYLFRREIVERIGGWLDRFPVIQDARFVLDCALRGAKFVYCQGIAAYYRTNIINSVSTRDSSGFVRDCFNNALEVGEWWEAHGGITEERKGALLEVYGYVARASFKKDKATFDSAYSRLKKINPGYLPLSPRGLRFLSRLVGYEKAEAVAFWYRRAKLLGKQ